MSQRLWALILFVGLATIATALPRGTVPKSAVTQYRAHAERNGVGVGATLLTPDQVHKAFAANVNRCCFVVEVALYPKQDSPLDLSLDDLTMRVTGDAVVVRPYSARAVAATIQEKVEQGRNVTTSTSVGVGYESGTYIDPVTGQPTKVKGVTTSTGVGVAVGPPGSQPGATNQTRDSIEIELAEQALPEGSMAAPVSGYLYFPKASLKKKKDTPLQLHYQLKDQTVILSLPEK
jgi:hypothetical protein